MSSRFFHHTPITTGHVTLDGAEAHHLLHVCRAKVGQEVTLFDGSGIEFPAVIEKLGRATVELRIARRSDVDRELPFELVLGVSLPKGDRQKWLVEKLTEIGVSKLVPIVTERGVAQPTATARERLNRSVIEASKQCGRNRLMEIAQAQAWDEWVESIDISAEIQRIVADPGGSAISSLDCSLPRAVYLAVGPEGGFPDGEVATAASAGWQAVSLGPRILRVETAAIVLAGWFGLRT